jgi:Arc/MetJ family transcription regulator
MFRYHVGMIRTQVQLSEEQLARLQRKTAIRRVSVAALVRDAVEQSLHDDDMDRRHEQALTVVGRFHSGSSDVITHHDRYLSEALGP